MDGWISNLYKSGSYSIEDGTGTTGTAEVGFYTDDEGIDYTHIECWKNDCKVVYFIAVHILIMTKFVICIPYTHLRVRKTKNLRSEKQYKWR